MRSIAASSTSPARERRLGRRRALVLALLLAGCSHLPGRGAAPVPPRKPSPPVDLDPNSGGRPHPGAAIGSQEAAPPPIGRGSQPRRDGEDFADLFDRIRRGFALPRVEDESVDRQVDWYLRHRGYLDRSFRRGRRYLHHIVEALERRGMPRELALLPVLESAFDPFASSPCSASGLWQFIPSTGRLYGLDRTWWYEGRRDVLDATRAALEYLEALHGEFGGDWLLALAAYNTGALNVERAVARNRTHGHATDFFHLDLPPETRAYVPGLLALRRLVEDPAAFGLALPAIPDEPYFARVEIDHQLDLGVAADLAGVPRSELLALNPGFKRWATAPDGPQRLLVPAAAAERFARALAELPSDHRLRIVHHRLGRGDTLGTVAARYGISVEALRVANPIDGQRIRPGRLLLIPLSYRANMAAGNPAIPLGGSAPP